MGGIRTLQFTVPWSSRGRQQCPDAVLLCRRLAAFEARNACFLNISILSEDKMNDRLGTAHRAGGEAQGWELAGQGSIPGSYNGL
jgi:hypothetical protein